MVKWDNAKIYTPIPGRALDSVPKALEDGLFLTMAQAMARKTEVAKLGDEELIDTWFGNGFWTMTPSFYSKNGNVTIGDVNDEQVMNCIRQITPALNDKMYYGRMVLSHDFRLSDISGDVFNRKDIAKYGNKLMSEKDAKKNIFWRALANKDQGVLDGFAEQVYKLGKDKYGKTELMGVWFSNHFEENNMGLVWAGSLSDNDSNAVDYYAAFYSNGLVIKVQAPEAHRCFTGSKRS
jgi:hypothetical protein